MTNRKQIERAVRKLRTKLWDLMYTERPSLSSEEYQHLDSACVQLTYAIERMNKPQTKENKQ
jgi:hypothetical protein